MQRETWLRTLISISKQSTFLLTRCFRSLTLQISDVNVLSFFKNLPWLGPSPHTFQEATSPAQAKGLCLQMMCGHPPFSDLFKLNSKKDVSDKLHPPAPPPPPRAAKGDSVSSFQRISRDISVKISAQALSQGSIMQCDCRERCENQY